MSAEIIGLRYNAKLARGQIERVQGAKSFLSFAIACAAGRIGRTKGGVNSQLHAICDGFGQPIILLYQGQGHCTLVLLTEGQMTCFNSHRKKYMRAL